MSMAVAILVAVIALVIGIILMAHHKDGRGAIFIVAAPAALIIALLARPRT
jgi:ABC-type Mn2+/Zn2+ transport system permease subunit